MSGRRVRKNRAEKRAGEGVRRDEKLARDPIGQPDMSARPELTSVVTYVIEPNFPSGHPKSGKSTRGVGAPGIYEATYALAIPGLTVARTDVNFPAVLEEADSLLYVPKGVKAIDVKLVDDNLDPEVGFQDIEVGINSHQRISYVKLRFEADSFASAAHDAHDLVMPLLSRWSFQHNVPITTSALELRDLTSGGVRFDTTLLAAPKLFGDNEGSSTPEGRKLLAAFREGLSSMEPLYQALCMFRVIEGCYVLRNRRRAQAKTGRAFKDPGERLELSQITAQGARARLQVEAAFKPYVGKKFTNLRDIFREDIRHAVAHLDLDGDPLAADNYEDVQKVKRALPVMHHMARMLLSSELNHESAVVDSSSE